MQTKIYSSQCLTVYPKWQAHILFSDVITEWDTKYISYFQNDEITVFKLLEKEGKMKKKVI